MGKKEDVELLNAVFDMDYERVKKALEQGADPNYITENPEEDGLSGRDVPEKSTALLLAAENNDDPRILKLLIEKGANLSAKNSTEETVLMRGLFTVTEQVPETLKTLLDQKPVVENIDAVDDNKMTALHIALFKLHDVKAAKLLLQHGADPTLKDNENGPSLNSIFFINYPELLEAYLGTDETLIKNKLDAAVSADQGPRLLEIALITQNKKLLDQLLDLGLAKIGELQFENLIYCLIRSIKAGKPDAYSLIESVFVKIDEKRKQQINNEFKKRNIDLMFESVKYGNLKLTESLHLMGESLGKTYNSSPENLTGASLLHVAAKHNHPMTIEFLIKQKLDPNVLDSNSYTPLYTAVWYGNKASIEVLMQQGADASIPDKNGELPLQIAQELIKQESIVKLIQGDKHLEKRVAANTFFQNLNLIKKMGHALGLRESIEVDMGSQGKKANIPTEGQFSLLSLDNMLEYIHLYQAQPDHDPKVQNDFKTIHEALTFTTEYMRFDGTHSAQDMEARYKADKLAIVPSGWYGHATTEVFYKNHLIDSNRGAGMDVTGTLIRKIRDRTRITANYLDNLKTTKDVQTLYDYQRNLWKAVDIRRHKVALPTKGQKWGTCGFVNLKSSFMGILYLFKLEQLTSQQSIPQAGLLLGALDAKQKAEFKRQALEYAKREYKKFTTFIRQTALEELLKIFQSATTSSARKEIASKLLLNYIQTHCGQERPSFHLRLAKRNSEILRLKYIFQNIPETERKKLLIELSKRNIILFEIASRSADTAYSELLANQWPVNIQDILTQKDPQGYTPLIRTVSSDTAKEVEHYMKFDNTGGWLNFQEPNLGLTALHYAVMKQDVKKVELLANHPEIDFSLKDKNGQTAFSLAASKSNAEIMKVISKAEERQRQAKADSFKP